MSDAGQNDIPAQDPAADFISPSQATADLASAPTLEFVNARKQVATIERTVAAEQSTTAFQPSIDKAAVNKPAERASKPKRSPQQPSLRNAIRAGSAKSVRKPATPAKKPIPVNRSVGPATISTEAGKRDESPTTLLLATTKDDKPMTKKSSVREFEISKVIGQAQKSVSSMFDKSIVAAEKLQVVTKDNSDAIKASGKIAGAGVKQLGQEVLTDGKIAFTTLKGDFKQLAATKKSSDFLVLQGQIAGRNLDATVAFASRNGQAIRSLLKAVVAPIAQRAKTNLATVRATAK